MRTCIACLLLLVITTTQAQDKPAYKLFTREGKGIDYTKMIKALAKADIVLVGELHDNSLDHWLELQVAKDLYALRNDLVLGFEMFEADDQLVLDEYLTGVIEERHLLNEAKVWENYKTDYKPLIEFAKEKKLPAIATNPPRRYANLVYRKGIEALQTLPEDAKKWIAPLPIEIDLTLPGYKSMGAAAMGGHGGVPANDNMAKSQAVKDATMAYFILKNRKGLLVHYHGAYHSKNFEGIVWYLKKAAPDVKIVTIHSVEQASIDDLENENRGAADFIIAIPKDMTKTY
ncbi:ChaN family lipoprotein [Parachryseolinea silvisoli]|uniref:ChaN family lipoprotein n=1 Tax=Parachryseolinea silvisoli TaxID=2873601 RepID=UPI002265EC8C|nr:ChaN family lipoprotein [Parachryseolinea silvisoli]MCD9017236.1 ChaN family lipoprotein [Parachryseolinea silvisoli]